MDLTIVSGTFNRISYLKKMVFSARRAIIPKLNYSHFTALNYEFVIVDGGSIDGTIEWCKTQPDIRLIEHGELRGACSAFNDGAHAARGQYVLLANDDIEFLDDGIFRAWVFMQTHPNCGMGCFYQDRNHQGEPEHKKWHVEEMPIIVNGIQSRGPYGQVAIIPRILGDQVGWWGDYLHTYGGDNELSCNIYELGFDVIPLYHGKGKACSNIKHRKHGSCIHDSEPNDALRRKNNMTDGDPRKVKGHHPDSYKWGKKWSRNGMIGPFVKHKPKLTLPHIVKERLLYLSIQKQGLHRTLSGIGCVLEYNYTESDNVFAELSQIVERFKPTICLFQIQDTQTLSPTQIWSLKRSHDAWWINYSNGYQFEDLLSNTYIELARIFDLQLTASHAVLEQYKLAGINAAYWESSTNGAVDMLIKMKPMDASLEDWR